jgi:predicted MPP superfamily phosphohydrolase
MLKNINARVKHRHGTTESWNRVADFVPLEGELIIYDADATNPAPRLKVGDGTKSIAELPFTDVSEHAHDQYLTEQDISGKADKSELFSKSYNDLTDKPSIPARVAQLQDSSLYATNTYVDSQIANVASGLGGIPQYVYKGAERTAKRVMETRNHASLVIGALSDLHTSGVDDSATSVKHACFALNEINKYTQLDLVAVLGDIMVDHMDSVNIPGFKYVRQQLDPIVKAVPFVQLEGNHDLDEVNTTAAIRRQEYYSYIGSNNVDVVTHFGNEFRNYGYKDFNNKRIRVIYLNTSDVAEEGITTHLRISNEQFNWFVNTALNFSDKDGASDWQVIVLTHIPLNYTNKYLQALLQLLKDYKDKKNGSISPDGTAISYDFRNNAQTFICHIHGHIHNFRTEWFDNVLSITVPNACFGRNNEYGVSSSYDETVHELYGDLDKDGNQRVYKKTEATVEDTAFSVLVIDGRVNNKVHVYNYGAGLHRIIDLVDKSLIEEEIDHYEGEGLTPSGDFVNAVPLSTTIGSTAVYNGKGYKNDVYVSSSGGVDSSAVGYVATGVMEYPVNDVYAHEIYILGADFNVTDSKVRIGLFTADGTIRAVLSGESAITGKFKVTQLGDKYYKLEPLYNTNGTPMIYASYGSGEGQAIAGMRLSLKGIGQNLFISMKNPIVAGLDGETVEWYEYTNVVPTSIDTDGTVFNTTGYKEGTRLNSSGAEATLARAICSGFIPYNNEDIRAYGARVDNLEAGAFYVCFYNAAFEKIGVIPGREFSGSNPGLTSEMVDERMLLTIDVSEVTNENFKGYMNDATYMRVSMSSCSGQVFVVTLNERLTLA